MVEEVLQQDQDLVIVVNVLNKENTDLDDLKVAVVIPELGIKKSSRYFDLDDNHEETKVLVIELPEYTEPGMYDVRITVSNDDNIHRVKHRLFRLN